jgi:hypothetical protein
MTAPWLGPAINAGGSLYGSHVQGRSADRARQMQADADARMLAYERERDAELKRQWDAEQANLAEQRAFDRQQIAERQARAEPYRQASLAALARLPDVMAGNQWLSPSNVGRPGTLGSLARR